ncbi:MAG: acetyl-CoA carboxylase biotin carboxyl carrier protein subunit [Verrucomicrobiales bacterium]|nr:acetyl-CoA carboxylase biotin carboxyl carrier protein subunit [Verrucomicrobiales bacterium]
MIKKLRVTVDGKSYDVTVELFDESESMATAPAAAPAPAPVIATPRQTPPPPPPVPVATTAPSAATGPGSVVSPLAGLVVEVAVAVGQDVKEGDKVLTLEAMKMNTVVSATKSGKVSEVRVVVGDAVSEAQVLAVIA